jgi:hypothetical protein
VANGNTQGVEAKLWAMADALRNNMDAAEYKHVVLGFGLGAPADRAKDILGQVYEYFLAQFALICSPANNKVGPLLNPRHVEGRAFFHHVVSKVRLTKRDKQHGILRFDCYIAVANRKPKFLL